MIPPIQVLLAPNLVVRMVPDFQGLNLPPLQSTFFYGFVEQVNYGTVGIAVGDIVLFERTPQTPSFYNNGNEYWLVNENNVSIIALSTASRIFDYTFDYTFE